MAGSTYRLRPIALESGERYPLLLDSKGMPHWHATLFVTTQLRNEGKAANTMMSVLAAIRALLTWASRNSIDLEDRFAKRLFLNEQELESLWRHLGTRRSGEIADDVARTEKLIPLPRNVERCRAKPSRARLGISRSSAVP